MPQAPQPITAETVITRNQALMVAPVHDEIMMMDIVSGRYYGLDAIGGEIWAQLAAPQAFGDLVTALVAEYDAPEAQIANDLAVLIGELAENGVVTLG